MAAGDPAGAGLDHGTAALRRLMVRAADDDAARAQALAAVMRRRVLVATWPQSPDSVRTLTNSDGEQAMPLFTGGDALVAAAPRFGWPAPDGSVSHRELDAVEALRGAVTNAVHFVVFDICADHSVEFSREEIEAALRNVPAHAPCVEPAAAPQTPPALGEIDSPFGRERTTGLTAIVEERPRGTRPDPRAEPSLATPLGAVAVARVAVPIGSRSTMAGTRAPAVPRRPERVTTPLAMEAVQARAPTPPAFAAVQPAPAPARVARPVTPPPFDAVGPTQPPTGETPAFVAPIAPLVELPSLDATDGFAMAEAPLDGGFGFDLASEEPEAKPAALEAAAMMQQIGKMAGDAATQQAAAEVASMLKQMAMKGSVEEEKPSAAHNAARALAAMLLGSAAAAQPAAAVAAPPPVKAVAAAPLPPAAAAAPAAAPKKRKAKGEARAGSTDKLKAAAVPEPASDCVLGPLETPLEDGLLNTISDGLRKYPEVEWACEVSDGSAVAVIGVRVAPGFMTNVPEIKNAIARAGDAHGTRLAVLILSDPQQMKEARSQGSVFFPWRKKGKR